MPVNGWRLIMRSNCRGRKGRLVRRMCCIGPGTAKRGALVQLKYAAIAIITVHNTNIYYEAHLPGRYAECRTLPEAQWEREGFGELQ